MTRTANSERALENWRGLNEAEVSSRVPGVWAALRDHF